MWRRSGFLPAKAPRGLTGPGRSDAGSEEGVTEEVFDGLAILDTGDGDRRVNVRLAGHLDPIDGRYHWQGTILDAPSAVAPGPVRLTIGTRTVDARITERTSQGTHSIAGVGEPPFELDGADESGVSAAG